MNASEGTREKQRASVTVDRDGVIQQWGDAVTEVVGYSADETLGRNLNVVIPPVLRSLHWHGFDRAMRRGRLSRPDKTYKVPAVRRDRRIVVAHATFELIPGHGGDTDGAVVCLRRRRGTMGKGWRGELSRTYQLCPSDLSASANRFVAVGETDSRCESPHLGYVVAVVVAVYPQQVGFFGAAYGYLDRHNEDHEDAIATGLGANKVSPSVNTTIAAKIGLRTRLNVPVRTSVVVSVVSMPTRQDSPISSCA
jgi:PAS domain S-box-containing protein